jgi:molybdopterin synthase catalytic subunit
MDYLKSEAPFWKRNRRRDAAQADWVAPKASDADALDRWR